MRKLQSAVEYLTTYGWMILIVTVVLVAFYYFGVANPSSLQHPKCLIAQSSLSCISFVMANSGVLYLNLGNYAQEPINITGIGCGTSNTIDTMQAPVNPPSNQVELADNSNYTFEVQCYNDALPFSGKIGSFFTGTVVVNYTNDATGLSGLIYGSLEVPVSTISTLTTNSINANAIKYVPLSLTNLEPISTSAPFEQKIIIDSAEFSNVISPNWNNIEFSTGPMGTGSTLEAWVESGASNTATDTVVWVNVPSGIPAGKTVQIYMNFMPTNVMSANGPTGEAPTLSPSYGQYDNGALVFDYYTDFAGTTVPSGWDIQPSSAGGIDDGITLSPTSGSEIATYVNGFNPQTETLDAYGQINSGPGNNGDYVGWLVSIPYSRYAITSENNAYYLVNNNSISSSYSIPTGYATGVTNLISISATASNSSASVNYGATYTNSNSFEPTLVDFITVGASSGNPAVFIQWLRVRSTPPNGVMPTATISTTVK
jgi:hypothetical protein